MTKSFARFTKANKKQSKRRPLRQIPRLPTPLIASSASDTSSTSTPTSTSPSSPTTSPSTSSSEDDSFIPVASSILPAFSLQDALMRSSLPAYLINLRGYGDQATQQFCNRIANILRVIYHHLKKKELQCAVDNIDKFLQSFLMKPFDPLVAFVNARKNDLGPATMLSRFDDLSVFVSWYCLQDIARYFGNALFLSHP